MRTQVVQIKQLINLSDGYLMGLSQDGKHRYLRSVWGWVEVNNDNVVLTEAEANELLRKQKSAEAAARQEAARLGL
jgi:hypothetical protein